MSLTDAFLAFPRIFLVLLLVSLTTPSLLLVNLTYSKSCKRKVSQPTNHGKFM